MKRDERGFSLIELLVVVVVISLLAAIGIPVFFAQRERAWEAQTVSALRNAATAMDGAAVSTGGSYTSLTIPQLVATEGLKYSESVVDLAVASSNEGGFCLVARHTISRETFYWDSADGKPSGTDCSGDY